MRLEGKQVGELTGRRTGTGQVWGAEQEKGAKPFEGHKANAQNLGQ